MQKIIDAPRPPKKHAQFILAMDSSYFLPVQRNGCVSDMFRDGLNNFPAEWFLMEAQSHIVIRERNWLDNQVHAKWQHRAGKEPFKGDPTYRQFLPYCVIRIALPNGEWQYFLYRREDTVGEVRLAGNVSAGYGGHIDLVDVVFNAKSVIDLAATIRLSSRREIFGEETAIYDAEGKLVDPETLEVRFADKFITQETEVESLHLGIVMTLDLPVGYRVETPENELTSMEPMTARQLLASGLPIEPWTRAIMEDEVRMMDNPTPDMFSSEPAQVGERDSPILKNMNAMLELCDGMARTKLIAKSADVAFDLIQKLRAGGKDDSYIEVEGGRKPRPYLAMVYHTVTRAEMFDSSKKPEPSREFIVIIDEHGQEITLTDEEAELYHKLLNDKLKDAGLTILGELSSLTGETLLAVADANIPLQWEDVKDLTLTLDGHDANNAAFNESVTGIPTTPPTAEEVAAYQDKLGQELESNVDTLMTGVANAPRIVEPVVSSNISEAMKELEKAIVKSRT